LEYSQFNTVFSVTLVSVLEAIVGAAGAEGPEDLPTATVWVSMAPVSTGAVLFTSTLMIFPISDDVQVYVALVPMDTPPENHS